MTIRQKASDNPAMAGLITLGSIIGAFVVVIQGIDVVDNLIMTETEAMEIHRGYDLQLTNVGKKIDEQAILNECRWLSDKIDAIGREIYTLDRDEASPDYIRSRRVLLQKHKEKYSALQCISRL